MWRRDDIGDVVVSVFSLVVTLVFLVLVKLPIVIKVSTGAQCAQTEHGFSPLLSSNVRR